MSSRKLKKLEKEMDIGHQLRDWTEAAMAHDEPAVPSAGGISTRPGSTTIRRSACAWIACAACACATITRVFSSR
jgi:hypothetical protein